MFASKILAFFVLFIASVAQAKFTRPTQTTFSALNFAFGQAPSGGAYGIYILLFWLFFIGK
jgi:DNA-binding helix-hairpin-helix protein with protein kinase domain